MKRCFSLLNSTGKNWNDPLSFYFIWELILSGCFNEKRFIGGAERKLWKRFVTQHVAKKNWYKDDTRNCTALWRIVLANYRFIVLISCETVVQYIYQDTSLSCTWPSALQSVIARYVICTLYIHSTLTVRPAWCRVTPPKRTRCPAIAIVTSTVSSGSVPSSSFRVRNGQ